MYINNSKGYILLCNNVINIYPCRSLSDKECKEPALSMILFTHNY